MVVPGKVVDWRMISWPARSWSRMNAAAARTAPRSGSLVVVIGVGTHTNTRVHLREGRLGLGDHAQVPALERGREPLVGDVVDGRPPGVELGDAVGGDVDAVDEMPGLGERDRQRQTDVAETDHCHAGVGTSWREDSARGAATRPAHVRAYARAAASGLHDAAAVGVAEARRRGQAERPLEDVVRAGPADAARRRATAASGGAVVQIGRASMPARSSDARTVVAGRPGARPIGPGRRVQPERRVGPATRGGAGTRPGRRARSPRRSTRRSRAGRRGARRSAPAGRGRARR